MTPEIALQILNNASSLATLNRGDHEKVLEAIQTISTYLKEAEVEQKTPKVVAKKGE